MPILTLFADENTSINSASPNSNNAGAPTLRVSPDPEVKALLRFDLSALPQTAAILSARLFLFALPVAGDQQTSIEAHLVAQEWVEAEATWNIYASGQNWDEPGAAGDDDTAGMVGGLSVGEVIEPRFYAMQLAATAKHHLGDQGLILTAKEGSIGDFMIASNNADNENQRPFLMIHYAEANPGVSIKDIIDEISASIYDHNNDHWSRADLLAWLNDAINQYSLYLPALQQLTIFTQAGTTEYSLELDTIQAIRRVEHPPGNFLSHLPVTESRFGSGHYDYIRPRQNEIFMTLILGRAPDVTGRPIHLLVEIYHMTGYDDPDSETEFLTVPYQHHHILKAFVSWRATFQRKMKQEHSPTSNSSLLMSMLATNADRSERIYRRLLAAAIDAEPSESGPVSWASADR